MRVMMTINSFPFFPSTPPIKPKITPPYFVSTLYRHYDPFYVVRLSVERGEREGSCFLCRWRCDGSSSGCFQHCRRLPRTTHQLSTPHPSFPPLSTLSVARKQNEKMKGNDLFSPHNLSISLLSRLERTPRLFGFILAR